MRLKSREKVTVCQYRGISSEDAVFLWFGQFKIGLEHRLAM